MVDKPVPKPQAAANPVAVAKTPVKPALMASAKAPVNGPAKPVAVAKPVTPVVAKPTAPVALKPVVPEAPKPDASTSTPVASKTPVAAAIPVTPTINANPEPAKPMASTINEGTQTMNDTFAKIEDTAKTFATDASTRANAAFGDMSSRAKDAMAKSSRVMEDAVEFSKGNLEAVVASTRIAAKGAQDIAKYSAEYGRRTIEGANETAKKFASVKSPTEFFQLQSEVAKSNLDAVVAEASKFTENYLKLLGEIVQPMQSRYAVAVEKAKTAVAA